MAKNEGRPGVDSGEWFYHAFASYDTDLLSGRVAYMDIGQNYEPGIGFVPRPDQKNLSLSGSFNPRPSWELVRQMELALDYERIETHEKVVETQIGRFAITANFDTGDRLWLSSEVNNELVPAPFEIAPDVFVAGGSYGFRPLDVLGNHRSRAGRRRSRSSGHCGLGCRRRPAGRGDASRRRLGGEICGVIPRSRARAWSVSYGGVTPGKSRCEARTTCTLGSPSRLAGTCRM